MFYQDVLDSFAPSHGILETDTIDIERTNGSNKTSCQINGEEVNIDNPKQHYYWSNQNYIGLRCRIYKKDGSSYVKEYNIAHLEKKINGWSYLTKKRIDMIKQELREMNGVRVNLENSNTGFLIKDLEQILKKKPKKKGRKPKIKQIETKTIEQAKPVVFSFEAFSDNSLKIAMAEYAELILTGHLPEEGIINKLIIAYKVDNQQKSSMMSALLKEVSNRWKS